MALKFDHALEKGFKYQDYGEMLEKTIAIIISSNLYKRWLKVWKMDPKERDFEERIKKRKANKKRYDAKKRLV